MKPTIPEVVERFAAYFAANPAWGSLHVVLDDGNVADSSVQFCIEYAAERGDDEGAALGRVLLTMSKTQRSKLPAAVRARKAA